MLIAEVRPIEAQSQGGTLAGTVTDRSGAVLSDATVEMTGGGRALTFSTRADGSTAF